MPFIEEEKFKLMQEDLDNAKLKREEFENELNSVNENFTSFKKKSKKTPVLLGLLLGLALGACYYLYTNNGVLKTTATTSNNIALIKKNEGIRVLDSVKRAQQLQTKKVVKSGVNKNNLDSTISNVNKNTAGETMYSVQIGVFSKKKYALLSSKTIPSIVSSGDSYFKYSLGLYTTLNEAKKLKNELIKVGFKDAFVASYINGKRQKIHN